MDLVIVVFNAIVGINIFQAFWISGIVLLIVFGWHNDLVRVVNLIEMNQLDPFDLKEWKRRKRNLTIGLKVAQGLLIISLIWMAIVGLK